MKSKIKSYFENLEPNKIGLDKKIKVKSVSKLGMGDANANFIVKTNQGNFVFRMSIQKKNDMDEEFFGLRALEGLNIAPKAWIHDKSKKLFEGSFIILSYIEGKICPQKKSFYTIKRIKKLGKLLGEVHNIKIKGNLKKLKRDSSIKGYGSYLDSIWRNYSGSLRRNVKNELFLEMIENSHKKLKKGLPIKYRADVVFSQGDFHEENIIFNKEEFKLIDFEILKLMDRGADIGKALMEYMSYFGEKEKEIFLQSYIKATKIKDKNLLAKVKIWTKLKLFGDFLWSIDHIFNVRKGDFHLHYIENNNFRAHINYTKKMFEFCIKEKVVNSQYKTLNIMEILK